MCFSVRFRTGAEYQTMAKHFKEGKMRNVMINKEKYRAVTLERKLIIINSVSL